MLTLHTFTNNYDDGEIYHQFLQEGRQPLLESRALASELTLGDFLSENIIEPLDLTKKRDKDRLEGLRQNGLVDRLLDAAVRLNMKDRQAGCEAFETHFGDWEFDSLVIQEPTLRELQEDVWASDPEFPKEDWKSEVERDETHLGYWEWVESQREQDDRHFLIRHTEHPELFWCEQNRFVDFASAARFQGSDRFSVCLPSKGEWVLENDVIPWKVGQRVKWTDPDKGICSRTGVLAFIASIGDGRLAVSFEDGWEADVLASELKHDPIK